MRQFGCKEVTPRWRYALLLCMASKNPLRLHDGYAELQRLLVLDPGSVDDGVVRRVRGTGRRCRSGADEVRGINLNLVAPFRAHLAESQLRVLEQDVVLYGPEADGDARGVGHGVCAHAQHIGWVYTSGCAEDELEGVLGVELETRDLGGRVGQGRRNSCHALAVTVQVEGAELRGGEFELGPLECDGCLGDIAELRGVKTWMN